MHPVVISVTLKSIGMTIFLLSAAIAAPVMLHAQNAITSDFVEGGKVLIELIKVIRTPRPVSAPASYSSTDSCVSKKLADISFKNKTDKTVWVSLYLRNGNIYDTPALSLKLSAYSQESLYDLKTGIYKYTIESEVEEAMVIIHQGELKLQPCDKLVKEIKGS